MYSINMMKFREDGFFLSGNFFEYSDIITYSHDVSDGRGFWEKKLQRTRAEEELRGMFGEALKFGLAVIVFVCSGAVLLYHGVEYVFEFLGVGLFFYPEESGKISYFSLVYFICAPL